MKRLICILLAALLLALPVSALEIDPHTKMDGMSKTWYQGYAPAIKNHILTLCLPVKAGKLQGKITASIALDDPNVFLLTSQQKAVKVSAKDGVYPVKLTLNLERYRRNGDYPATITVKDEEGTVETMPYIIRIRDGYASHETLEPVISDVVGNLDVGTDGGLSLTITNPTTTQSIMDAEITVMDATGDIQMTGSNRMKLSEILPGQTETVTIPMTVRGNASISQHILDVKLTYTVLGKAGEWQESFNIPVTQAIRLEQGGVQLPTAIAGELSNMTLPLMNMGKGELQNVLVKLESDEVLDAQSVLVGTLTPGETKQAKLTFTPRLDSVGTHPGLVSITCEDAYGNTFSQPLEVSLIVDEPLPEVDPQQEEEDEKLSTGTIVLILLCVALSAGLVVQGMILTKKIHNLEEERL